MNLSLFTKPICKFLIHRYMGQCLRTEIHTDQLEFRLADGTAAVQRVSLNTECINEVVEPLGIVSVVEGYVEEVSICVPWKKLMTESTIIKISGLELTLTPMSDINLSNTSDLVSSMIGSMASTKDLARSMIEDENIASEVANAGVEQFAGLIDQVIKKIQVIFEKMVIRIEATSTLSTGMEIQIDEMAFTDDVGDSNKSSAMPRNDNAIITQPGSSTEVTEINKIVEIQGVRIYTDIWTPLRERILSTSRTMTSDEAEDAAFQSCYSNFASRSLIGELPPTTIPPNPVLIAQFCGKKHIVRIQMSSNGLAMNDKTTSSKKVSIDMNLAGLLLFYMTPSQLVLVKDLFSRLIPNNNTHVNTSGKDAYGGRPMRPEHFQKITEQCHGETLTGSFQPTNYFDGWSGQEQFYEVLSQSTSFSGPTSNINLMTKNEISDAISDTNSVASTMISTEKRADVLKFHLRCPMMLGILTYDDPLSLEQIKTHGMSTDYMAIRNTLSEMVADAEQFFDDANNVQYNEGRLDSLRESLAKLCQRDHIRFVSREAKLSFDTSSNSTEYPFKFTTSLADCDICECLQPSSVSQNEEKPGHFDLLNFSDFSSNSPAFSLVIHNSRKHLNEYIIECNMENVKTELDLSIIDRIVNIISPDSCFLTCSQTAVGLNKSIRENNTFDSSALNDIIFSDAIKVQEPSTYHIKINAKSWIVNLRIPIADLSDGIKEFWKKNVYDEYLKLTFCDVALETQKFSVSDLQTHGSVVLQCKSMEGIFVGDSSIIGCTEDEKRFVYANSAFEGMNLGDSNCVKLKFDYDTRNKSLKVGTPLDLESDSSLNQMAGCIADIMRQSVSYANGPFSQCKEYSENEENLAPMRRHELLQYSENCFEMSDVNIEMTMPHLNLSLPSQKFFEIIYNRFGNDLALWTTKAPALSASREKEVLEESFSECQSDHKHKKLNRGLHDMNLRSSSTISHKLSFKLQAMNANVILQTNNATEKSETAFLSQLGAHMSNAEFFFVYGFNGDENVSHLTTHASTVELFHRNLIEGQFGFPRNVTDVDRFLNRQKEDLVAIPTFANDQYTQDNFSLGLTLKIQPENNEKNILVSVGLRKTILYLRPAKEANRLWARQFSEFFNVVDYDVPGYTPSTPNIDFHLALSNVFIEYKHADVLPTSSIELRFEISQCHMRSHITPESERLRFRWEMQDSILAMRKNKSAEFINVMEIGCVKFEISTVTELSSGKALIFEFNCQNDYIKMWICSDTILEVIKLILEVQKSDFLFFAVSEKQSGADIEQVNKLISSVTTAVNEGTSAEDQKKIMEMVELALEESVFSSNNFKSNKVKHDDELCSMSSAGLKTRQYHDSSSDELEYDNDGSVASLNKELSPDDTEDEFIMVEKVVVSKSKNEERNSKSEADEYEYIIKVPEDATDVRFPLTSANYTDKKLTPMFKYCITNLTVHLFLFGGNDFGDVPSPSKAYSNWEKTSLASVQREAAVVGGRFRDHTVCVEAKFSGISLTNEIFDDDNDEQIRSRHRLKIVNIEWFDHVSLSEFHKILYMCHDSDGTQSMAPIVLINMTVNLAYEAKLTVSVMNIRLNLDQDTVEFLQDFATEIQKGLAFWNNDISVVSNCGDPITQISITPKNFSELSLSHFKSELNFTHNTQDLIDFNDENVTAGESGVQIDSIESVSFSNSNRQKKYTKADESKGKAVHDLLSDSLDTLDHADKTNGNVNERHKASIIPPASSSSELFIREFTFAPRCKIRFDYVGKRVNTERGPLLGFLIGMMDLRRSEVILKNLHNEKGLRTLWKVYEFAEEEWLADISYRQFAGLVSSYRPISSLVELSQGIRDLFAIPLSEMQKKNGHVVGGIQQGASRFGLSTTTAALDATQNLALAIQNVAAFAFDLVTPDSYQRRRTLALARRTRVAGDLREGFTMAYDTMRDGMYDTTQTLYAAAQEERACGGSIWGLRGILRHATPTAIRPILVASQAAVHVLNGIKNQLKPDEYREELEKWRRCIKNSETVREVRPNSVNDYLPPVKKTVPSRGSTLQRKF